MPFRNYSLHQMNRQYLLTSQLALAEQIVAKTGIHRGNCLEIAARPGYLGLALAQISGLQVYLMDNSKEMLRLAAWNIGECELEDRVSTLRGRVDKMPLPDAAMDLVVSQRSVFFWNEFCPAFREIYRVLAPGGRAYIGSSFLTEDIKERIDRRLANDHPKLQSQLNGKVWMSKMKTFEESLRAAGIPSFEINCSDDRFWILIRKNKLPEAASQERILLQCDECADQTALRQE